jgi:Zn-dependent protease with chaperone function
MNFFEAQDRARRSTLWLVLLFGLAVIGLILLTNLLVMFVITYQQTGLVTLGNRPGQPALPWDTFIPVALGVSVLVAGGSLFKLLQLAGGGRVVAETLGGQVIAQNSKDALHRKILNVVEEMAIASGLPVPSVYLLEEPGINAFAAGWMPGDAVIGITRGAVQQLSREELQGVIAHEFSHILNGDMRLNVRLTGVLHGILLLGLLGYHLMRTLRYARSSRSRNGGGIIAALLVLALGLIVIGYVGSFFGNWIKALVSRQREYLADSSAVQFTRSRDGIAGALKKIGGLHHGSRLQSPAAAEFSHAYFAQGVSAFAQSLFATHPPLATRIRRIDPRWNGKFTPPKTVAPGVSETVNAGAAGDTGKGQATAVVMGAAVADALWGIEHIGNPSLAHVGYAKELLAAFPPALKAETQDPYGVRAVIYALLIQADAAVQKRQWDVLRSQDDSGVYAKTGKLAPVVAALDRRLRLPLMDLSLPALRALTPPQYQVFRNVVLGLMHADNKISLGEWIMQRLLLHRLDESHGLRKRPPARYSLLGAVKAESELLLSLVAYAEHSDDAAAARAFDTGRKAIGAGALTIIARKDLSLERLNDAVDKLEQLKPLIKPRLLKACAACIGTDGQVSVDGIELLRALASSLDSPMPPVIVAPPATVPAPLGAA